MAKIKVPKTPKSAFDKSRPASALLRAQIEHLEAAAGIYPAPSRALGVVGAGRVRARSATPSRPKAWTEGKAAEYIHSLTEQLNQRITAPQGAVEPASTPPGDTLRARTPQRRSRKSARKQKSAPKQKTRKRKSRRRKSR